jgi:hypothetical protein
MRPAGRDGVGRSHATASQSHGIGRVFGLMTRGMCHARPFRHSRCRVSGAGPPRAPILRSWRSSWPQAGQVIGRWDALARARRGKCRRYLAVFDRLLR